MHLSIGFKKFSLVLQKGTNGAILHMLSVKADENELIKHEIVKKNRQYRRKRMRFYILFGYFERKIKKFKKRLAIRFLLWYNIKR